MSFVKPRPLLAAFILLTVLAVAGGWIVRRISLHSNGRPPEASRQIAPERQRLLDGRLKAFLAAPWSEAKVSALEKFFAPLPAADLVYLAGLLKAVPEETNIDSELRALGRHWGRLDGKAAIDFLTELFPRDDTALINPANATLQAWAAVDREGCARYAHQIGTSAKLPATWRNIALTAAGAAFGMKDFAYARQWAEQQGPLRYVAIRGVSLSIGTADYDACAGWLAKLSREESNVYDALMDGFVYIYTEKDPEKALHWLLHDLAPSDSRDISLKYGFRLVGCKAPDIAARFFAQPDHNDVLFRGRDLTDKDKALLHDEFYMEYLDGLMHSNRIEEAMPLIAHLSDRNNRWKMEETYYNVFDRFLLYHPELAGGKSNPDPIKRTDQ